MGTCAPSAPWSRRGSPPSAPARGSSSSAPPHPGRPSEGEPIPASVVGTPLLVYTADQKKKPKGRRGSNREGGGGCLASPEQPKKQHRFPQLGTNSRQGFGNPRTRLSFQDSNTQLRSIRPCVFVTRGGRGDDPKEGKLSSAVLKTLENPVKSNTPRAHSSHNHTPRQGFHSDVHDWSNPRVCICHPLIRQNPLGKYQWWWLFSLAGLPGVVGLVAVRLVHGMP